MAITSVFSQGYDFWCPNNFVTITGTSFGATGKVFLITTNQIVTFNIADISSWTATQIIIATPSMTYTELQGATVVVQPIGASPFLHQVQIKTLDPAGYTAGDMATVIVDASYPRLIPNSYGSIGRITNLFNFGNTITSEFVTITENPLGYREATHAAGVDLNRYTAARIAQPVKDMLVKQGTWGLIQSA